ncbi:hypothetical protein Dimus_024812 [Dionaea muscipula]
MAVKSFSGGSPSVVVDWWQPSQAEVDSAADTNPSRSGRRWALLGGSSSPDVRLQDDGGDGAPLLPRLRVGAGVVEPGGRRSHWMAVKTSGGGSLSWWWIGGGGLSERWTGAANTNPSRSGRCWALLGGSSSPDVRLKDDGGDGSPLLPRLRVGAGVVEVKCSRRRWCSPSPWLRECRGDRLAWRPLEAD